MVAHADSIFAFISANLEDEKPFAGAIGENVFPKKEISFHLFIL